jgi:hypothetical protein
MAFPCPGCGAPVEGSLERVMLRCRTCNAVLRSRVVETEGPLREYDVEVARKPETRIRVEVPWTPDEARRLRAWLVWSSVVTLGLVGVLYALARFAR